MTTRIFLYTVRERDIENYDLEPEDVERLYTLINGCVQFIKSEEDFNKLKELLKQNQD